MGLINAGLLFFWLTARYAVRHPLLAALNIASIALGISVYLAIQIANHSASEALRSSVDLVAGKADLEIRGEIEGELLAKIQALPGVLAATPIIEGIVTIPAFKGEYLRVIGVDPFGNQPFSNFDLHDQKRVSFDFEQWLTNPRALAVSRDFADKYHLREGQSLDVLVNSRKVSLELRFIIDLHASLAGSGARFAAMDIGFAQTLFGLGTRVGSIQLLIEKGREVSVIAAVRKMVPPTVIVAPPARRNGQVTQMLAAFQLNLSALSMVSLLVGMFLVYNTVSASVVRRRMEIGILRARGASPAEVRLLFLGEALLYGIAGLTIGVLAGIVLANLLVGAVGQTISSLYVLLSVEKIFVSPPQILLAVLAGLGSVLISAWLPANEAARLAPLHALLPEMQSQASERAAWRLPLLGAAFLFVAAACAWASLRGTPWLGFGSAFFLLTGCSLFAPLLTAGASVGAARLFKGHLVFALAAQNIRRSLRRTSFTVAALAASVAMMIGVSVMIFSFRKTINMWIERSLIADLFVAPASNETIGLNAFLPAEVQQWFSQRADVQGIDTFREIRLPFRDANIRLSVVHGQKRDNLRFLEGDYLMRNALLFTPDYVLISEPFGRRFQLRAGDSIKLPTPLGEHTFKIGGTYYDYTSDEGSVLICRETFDLWWKDSRIHSLAVYLKSSASFEPLADAFRQRFGSEGDFVIYSNASIRQRIFEIFEQTFAVTSVLRIIAIGVAVIGIFLTLSTLVTERRRELAVLRSRGASIGQIRGLILCEAGLVGILASLLGVVTGCGLATVLTFVVNKAFFGWTIQLSWPWLALIGTPIWLIPVALLSGWLPAVRAARLPLAAALRTE